MLQPTVRVENLLPVGDNQSWRCANIAMGFFVGHVFPEFVENSAGEKEIAEYKLVGTE